MGLAIGPGDRRDILAGQRERILAEQMVRSLIALLADDGARPLEARSYAYNTFGKSGHFTRHRSFQLTVARFGQSAAI